MKNSLSAVSSASGRHQGTHWCQWGFRASIGRFGPTCGGGRTLRDRL